ncbi:hypothetical protein L9F63_000531 [Diploptera punctata]|uniref:Uncharacterized protein n=1 Tax=Diploptera punctata TaxID=6984 RepID=A0AAD8ALI9_DIPPU|nr:hypothetical protein L9F63_000531 [Diploptera punctata]
MFPNRGSRGLKKYLERGPDISMTYAILTHENRDKEGNREKDRNKKSSNEHPMRDRERDRDRDRNKDSGRIRKDNGSNMTPASGQQRMRDGNTPSTPNRNVGQQPYVPRHEFIAGGDGRTPGSHGRHSGPNQNDGGVDR